MSAAGIRLFVIGTALITLDAFALPRAAGGRRRTALLADGYCDAGSRPEIAQRRNTFDARLPAVEPGTVQRSRCAGQGAIHDYEQRGSGCAGALSH